MAQQDIEIVISKHGKVKVHVRGAKGKACLEYADWLAQVIGRLQSQQLTSEFYEPDEKAGIDIRQRQRG